MVNCDNPASRSRLSTRTWLAHAIRWALVIVMMCLWGAVYAAPSTALSWIPLNLPDYKFTLNCSENRLVGVGLGYNGLGIDTTGAIFVDSTDDPSLGYTSQLATNQVLNGGTYGAGVFVVVGQKAIYSSTDGAVWKRQAT